MRYRQLGQSEQGQRLVQECVVASHRDDVTRDLPLTETQIPELRREMDEAPVSGDPSDVEDLADKGLYHLDPPLNRHRCQVDLRLELLHVLVHRREEAGIRAAYEDNRVVALRTRKQLRKLCQQLPQP